MDKNDHNWEKIQLSLLTLTFPRPVERLYKAEIYLKTIYHVRLALLLSIVFFGLFGILDAWIVPEAKLKLWFIRYVVYCPFALSIFLYSYTKSFEKRIQFCIASVVLIAGMGIIAMIILTPSASNNTYYAGLILVFIFGYTFFKLDFIYASIVGALIVISYEIAAIWISQTPVVVLINNNFFFLTGNLFGMFACYSIEFNSRNAFLQAKLLDSEEKKVKKANSELESKVEQRTGQLLKANQVLRNEIAERFRAEEKVRKSEEKYRSILETMEEGYYEFDLEGNLKFFNEAFQKIIGYQKEELLGTHYREYTEHQNAGKVFQALNNVYISHTPSKEFEWHITRKDGCLRYLETSVSLIRSEEGLAEGFQGMIRDVTERVLAEESLKKAYKELKYTQSQLVQSGKLASIGELAAGVAHELNQPLMVIRGNAQLIERNIRVGNLTNDSLGNQIEPIVRNTKRMMNIINHLRTFSRQSKSEFDPLDVNKVIEDSFLMIGEQLRLRNIEVVRELDSNLSLCNGDANQLEQVILNLLTNARDAIVEKVESEHPEEDDSNTITIVTQLYKRDPNFIEILIKDSGSGIKQKDRANIFDPFYTTKEVGKGTGLGLSISYGIIVEHNGKIEIAETSAVGTMFRILLPLSPAKRIAEELPEESVKIPA